MEEPYCSFSKYDINYEAEVLSDESFKLTAEKSGRYFSQTFKTGVMLGTEKIKSNDVLQIFKDLSEEKEHIDATFPRNFQSPLIIKICVTLQYIGKKELMLILKEEVQQPSRVRKTEEKSSKATKTEEEEENWAIESHKPTKYDENRPNKIKDTRNRDGKKPRGNGRRKGDRGGRSDSYDRKGHQEEEIDRNLDNLDKDQEENWAKENYQEENRADDKGQVDNWPKESHQEHERGTRRGGLRGRARRGRGGARRRGGRQTKPEVEDVFEFDDADPGIEVEITSSLSEIDIMDLVDQALEEKKLPSYKNLEFGDGKFSVFLSTDEDADLWQKHWNTDDNE